MVCLGMTKRNEISMHETAFYLAARDGEWHTANELAKRAQIAPRTARAFALKFVRLGLFTVANVWPAHKYCWSETAGKRNQNYLHQLDRSCEAFGVHHDTSHQ